MDNRLYVDHAATTPMRKEAVEAMMSAFGVATGNASGAHSDARASKNLLEEAREQAAALIGSPRVHDVVFTSGGTESDNLAVIGAAIGSSRPGVAVSSIEHKAVGEAARSLVDRGKRLSEIKVDGAGRIEIEGIAQSVADDTAVVSVMAANNETGVLQPLTDIVTAVRDIDSEIAVHTDAVQLFCSHVIDVAADDIDLLSLSSHKLGGPTGVGLLYVRSGTRLDPVVRGGGQEAGRRSGTYNVAGVVGMVAAMAAAVLDRDHYSVRVAAERDAFEASLKHLVPGAVVTGSGAPRIPAISHIRLPGFLAETALIRLDQAGVSASSGAACQSGAVEPSHVLKAMAMTDREASECIRFSFGWNSERGSGSALADAVATAVGEMA